jgi:hypothetical protein
MLRAELVECLARLLLVDLERRPPATKGGPAA